MSYIGAEIRRKEDLRLLAGQGQYADDLHLSGMSYAVFVRSPYAHAHIRSIDSTMAKAAPGVLLVLTGDDLVQAGLQPIPHAIGSSKFGADVRLANRDGSERARTPHLPLPTDVVRHVGEAVVVVVADTLEAAKDAADLVEIDWDELPAVTSALKALEPGAPQLWNHVPGNLALEAEIGDAAAVEAVFATAPHKVRFTSQINRVTGVHMEPRTASAIFDASSGRYTINCSGGGGVVQIREHIAESLAQPLAAVRILAPEDVGGNFGTRNATYPEWVVIAHAARVIGKPVKHVVDRLEAFTSDFQARDLHVDTELALDAEGTFLALRCVNTSNIGAHTLSYTPLNKGVQLMTGLYRIPLAFAVARAVMTNTLPTIPYRSAGRPEAMYAIERLVDLAARQCGFDRVELRRRNMIPSDAFPHANPFGVTYDSGDHIATMTQALEMADFAGFEARRAQSRAQGKLRGLGFANYIEGTGGNPRERAEITVRPELGIVEVILGTQDTGQGHRTAFAQLVASWLGLNVEQVVIRSGDTDFVLAGGGSHSGRSLRFGSIVMDKATRRVITLGTAIFAARHGLGPEDVEFSDGYFRHKSGNAVLHLFEVAQLAQDDQTLPAALQGTIIESCDEVTAGLAFPFGCAACELEIDPETGALEILRYTSVDDVGRALNPMIIHGQTHGGIVQGIGQALHENFVYDPETGQCLTASFMDYQMPRAFDFPSFDTAISEVPATSHPMGFRPGGEGGTTPALAVAINAVTDALAHLGVRHIEMPATPLRIWQAIQAATSSAASSTAATETSL